MPTYFYTDFALLLNSIKDKTKFHSIKLGMTLEQQNYVDLFSFPYPNNAILPNLTRLLEFSLSPYIIKKNDIHRCWSVVTENHLPSVS